MLGKIVCILDISDCISEISYWTESISWLNFSVSLLIWLYISSLALFTVASVATLLFSTLYSLVAKTKESCLLSIKGFNSFFKDIKPPFNILKDVLLLAIANKPLVVIT